MLQRFKPCIAVTSRPHRADFPNGMSAQEQAIMASHTAFWERLLLEGRALVTGPVQDPSGTHGFAVLFAESADAARQLLQNDPAQQICTYSYAPMLACYDEK